MRIEKKLKKIGKKFAVLKNFRTFETLTNYNNKKQKIMFTEINFDTYLDLFNEAKKLDKKISLNVSTPEYEERKRYFKSLEGCSALSSKGELCGLFRFKKGAEKVAKLHQKKRIELGGYWLNCYKGVLNEIIKNKVLKKYIL